VRISSAEGERQVFPTVPPVDPAIPTPLDTSIPEPAAIPTLGSGQYFEEDTIDTSLLTILHGDDEFSNLCL